MPGWLVYSYEIKDANLYMRIYESFVYRISKFTRIQFSLIL